MQYELLLTIFCAVFLLGAIAVFWLLLRQERQRSEDQKTFLSAATELKVQQADQLVESLEQQIADNQSRFERTLATAISEVTRNQELTQKSTDLTLTRALDGSNEAQKRAQSLMASTVALLATKDPIAYSQVTNAAAPIDTGGVLEPYTAADDAENDRLRQEAEQRAALDLALEQLAGLTKGGTGAYPDTGTAPTFAFSAPAD